MINSIEKFLSIDYCNYFITEYEDQLEKAKLFYGDKKQVNERFRKAFNLKLKDEDEKVYIIKDKICSLINCKFEELEDLELIKYPTGGFFKRHYDHSNNIKRTHTVNIFLNNNYSGGSLVFPQKKIKLRNNPSGSCVYWKNDETSLHACKIITEGEKWVITTWANKQENTEDLEDPEM